MKVQEEKEMMADRPVVNAGGCTMQTDTERSPSENLSSLPHPRSLLVPQPFSFLIGPGALAKIFLNRPQCGFLQFPFICFFSFLFFFSIAQNRK